MDLRARLREEEVRALFTSIDTDGNGSISMDEFFLYTLGMIQHHTGTGHAQP